ncbi:conserved hypothetical protein [Verticillium alfalfae VaMs.102]|uniref:Uncharacterized protein n=1 Tax=Verticillium alfalfae (strain VaMs.102 / ATCC MYA-4576 / FGSC 10136) TaxID=526221 RepID=C9SFA1_VERA1|nr:conserved hypothetical protein [Verticillium alfalfae VaMs.102]EEY17887.1 conserved hypothetical protein [Verticillium alfalfae VaMs.102]
MRRVGRRCGSLSSPCIIQSWQGLVATLAADTQPQPHHRPEPLPSPPPPVPYAMQSSFSKVTSSSTSDRAWDVTGDVQNGGTPPLNRTKSKQRDPPPALFLHPSPAASHVSIPGIPLAATTSAGVSSLPQQQATSHQRNGSLTVSAPSVNRPTVALGKQESVRSATDRTDALWAEMQATLEEVELSASGGTHVFGPDHDRKLADLRAAQISLAQAWARSEADDAIGVGHRDHGAFSAAGADEVRNLKGAVLGDTTTGKSGDGTDAGRSTVGTGSARPGSSGMGTERLGAKLEEETEADILLARKRREANDQYFQRVNRGVLDVVARLEEVAVGMRAVEQESKDIWGETESAPGSLRT